MFNVAVEFRELFLQKADVSRPWNCPVFDTAGERLRGCRLSHDAGEAGASGSGSRDIVDPGSEAAEVDRRGCQQVLQVRLSQAEIAAAA